jgi:ATP-binding cassette subfamily F protein 3
MEIGYYAQDQANRLNGEKTVFQTVDEVAEGEMRTKLRALLGAFLFQGDDVEKKVKVLSGGEKARLALCKLLLKPVNLLILDEPTNHLDMRSKDVLKEALVNYDGSMIVVSHDRDFLSGLVNIIREVTPAGLKEFRGDIFEFLKEKKADSIAEFERQRKQASVAAKEEAKPAPSGSKPAANLNPREKKELEKEKKRLKSKVGKLETDIQESEARLAEMDREMAELDYSDQEKSARMLGFYAAEKEKLEKLMEDWARAEEELVALLKSEEV